MIASYASQRSSGAPLVGSDGHPDLAAVTLLSKFDLVTLEATPWARDVSGNARADVPMLLRRLNPRIRLCLYVLAGDQWLAPTFTPQATDQSAFRMAFDAFAGTNGFLRGTDGQLWLQNFRGNLASKPTTNALGDVYEALLSTRLFDLIFLDCAHTSVGWTDGSGGRHIDHVRAGFPSLAEMERARFRNVTDLVARLKGLGVKVARNGTGPEAGEDVQFREGFGGLVSESDARTWVQGPGTRWLMGEWTEGALMLDVAASGRDTIVSCGPGRGWPPVMP